MFLNCISVHYIMPFVFSVFNRIYGFYDECKRRYNIKLWKTFTDCFNTLPIGKVKLCFTFFFIKKHNIIKRMFILSFD